MFKLILKSILKKKIAVLFIIIQLCIINFIIIEMLTNFNVFKNQEVEVNQILGDIKDDLLRVDFKDVYPSKEFADRVCEIENYLCSADDVKFAGGFNETTFIFNELENNGDYMQINKEENKNERKSLSVTDCILLDKNIENLMDINIKHGRTFAEDDFYLNSGEVIPILIGSKLNKIVNVGDTLTAKDLISSGGKNKFVVIGVLEAGDKSIASGNLMSYKAIDLDNKIIIPYTKDYQTDLLPITAKTSSYYICAKDKNDINNIKINLLSKADLVGLNIEVSSLDEIMSEYKENNKEVYNIIILTTIVTTIFAIFSISSLTLTSIKNRKKELGIRIVTGASVGYVKRLFLYEIVSISIFSSFITLIYSIYEKYQYYTAFLQQPFILSEVINVRVIIGTIILVIIIVFASSYIPLRKIEKIQPKDLIGGND